MPNHLSCSSWFVDELYWLLSARLHWRLVPVDSPHKGSVKLKAFPCYDVIIWFFCFPQPCHESLRAPVLPCCCWISCCRCRHMTCCRLLSRWQQACEIWFIRVCRTNWWKQWSLSGSDSTPSHLASKQWHITHWPLGDVPVILQIQLWNSLYRIVILSYEGDMRACLHALATG